MSKPQVFNSLRLAQRLRQLMGVRRLSAKTVSRSTGIPVNTLHNWLAGQMPRNLLQVKRVADFFGVSLDSLVFDEDIQIDPVTIADLIRSGRVEVVVRPVD